MEGVAMSISEFVQECDADYDAALRFAGSLPDGTDVEHTHPPYMAVAHVAPPLGDVVAQHETRLAIAERRICALESIVHRLLNAAEPEAHP